MYHILWSPDTDMDVTDQPQDPGAKYFLNITNFDFASKCIRIYVLGSQMFIFKYHDTR